MGELIGIFIAHVAVYSLALGMLYPKSERCDGFGLS